MIEIVLALVPLILLIVTLMGVGPLYSLVPAKTVVRTMVRTVYLVEVSTKYVYVNETGPILDVGTCHLYSLVFSNGTVWTLGYWIPTQQAWQSYTADVNTWYRGDGAGGLQYVVGLYAVVIKLGSAGLIRLLMIANVPYTNVLITNVSSTKYVNATYETPPGWVNIIYMGDLAGNGSFVFRGSVMNNSLVFPGLKWMPPLVISFNTTVTVLIEPYSTPHIPLILPCNWTVIKTPLTPEQALTLPAPMGILFAKEWYYTTYRLQSYPPYVPTWGFWVWYTMEPMKNITSLPWPVS